MAGLCRCALLMALALASWSIIPGLIGFEPTTVMSGSMTPRFQVGDAVITRTVSRADLAVGQVLLFDDPDQPGALRLHRLVEARGDHLETKGDANESRDSSSVRFAAVHGVGVLRVPFAGLPSYWVRSGQIVPLIAGGCVLLALVAGSQVDRRIVGPRHVDRESPGPRRRLPKHVLRAAVPVIAIGVLCGTAIPASAPAQATFATRISNGPSTFGACVDYPVRGTLPPSALAYFNYMEPTGSTTANRAVPGTSVSMFGSVVHGDGTCAVDSSPFISVGGNGASGLVAGSAMAVPTEGTIATWFRTGTPSGTIADIGSSGTAQGSSASNLVLYMSTGGSVVFGEVTSQLLGIPLGGITCQSGSGLANSTWHLVIATFSSTAGCTISVDGSVPVAGTSAVNATSVNLQLLSGFSGYWRLGYDSIGGFWPNVGSTAYFQGDLDESQVYTSVLTAQQQATILSRRR